MLAAAATLTNKLRSGKIEDKLMHLMILQDKLGGQVVLPSQ